MFRSHYVFAICGAILLNGAHGVINENSAFISPPSTFLKNSIKRSKDGSSIEINYHQSPKFTTSVITTLQMTNDETKSNAPLEEKELTPDTVIEMIEVTFINACLQLAKGYVDVLKLFIVSVKTGFGLGLSIPELVEKLEDFPIQSANRPLMPEEIKLRSSWMNIVYLMLENFDESGEFNTENSSVDAEIRERYGEYVKYVTDWRKEQNYEDRDAAAMVAELKVDDVLKACSSTTSSVTDAMEKAMLPQNLRVAVLTLVVIEEEKRCLDDDMPPQPNIPGTK